MGDVVDGVEGGDGFSEGGEGGDFDAGEDSALVRGSSRSKDKGVAYSASNWLGRIRSAWRMTFL